MQTENILNLLFKIFNFALVKLFQNAYYHYKFKEPLYNISIFNECTVLIEKSIMRVTDQYHEACRAMLNSDAK